MKFTSNQVLMLVTIAFCVAFLAVVFGIDTFTVDTLTSFCGACS